MQKTETENLTSKNYVREEWELYYAERRAAVDMQRAAVDQVNSETTLKLRAAEMKSRFVTTTVIIVGVIILYTLTFILLEGYHVGGLNLGTEFLNILIGTLVVQLIALLVTIANGIFGIKTA